MIWQNLLLEWFGDMGKTYKDYPKPEVKDNYKKKKHSKMKPYNRNKKYE